jgi:hypothetical protein
VVQGHYQLSGLVEGNYIVGFIPPEGEGVRAQFYDGESELSGAHTVPVATGSVTAPIDAALEAEATISGLVADASTRSGLAKIEVCAFELTGPEITACEYTEPSGLYSITDLPTGNYTVGFFSESVEEEEESLGLSPFPVQFWNDKPSWETADTLTLGLGVTTGIDAELGPPPPTSTGQSPATTATSTVPSLVPTTATPRTRCRSGRRWKKVKGKMRCVKTHKQKHHKRKHHGRAHPRSLSGAVPRACAARSETRSRTGHRVRSCARIRPNPR